MQINQDFHFILTLLRINQNESFCVTIKALLISALKKSIFKKAFKSIEELFNQMQYGLQITVCFVYLCSSVPSSLLLPLLSQERFALRAIKCNVLLKSRG